MNLSDFFPLNTSSAGQEGLSAANKAGLSDNLLRQAASENTKTLMNLVQLKPGQVFKGQVTDIGPDHVTIQSGGNNFTARFLEPVDLSISQEIFFEIKGNENDTITIAPLKETFNSPEDALIYRALDKAGLAATDLNLDIGEALLKNGLAVDKQNIQKFSALSLKYPQAALEQLVLLDKYNIKINDSAIQHLNDYMKWNSQTTKQLSDISDALPKMLSELADSQGKEGVRGFLDTQLFAARESGSLDKPEFAAIRQLDALLRDEGSSLKDIKEFISSSKDGLSQEFLKLYSLEPEQLGSGKLNEYYDNLGKQMEQLRQMAERLSDAGNKADDGSAVKDGSILKDEVEQAGNTAKDVNFAKNEAGSTGNTANNNGVSQDIQAAAMQEGGRNDSFLSKILEGANQVLGQMDFLSQMNQEGGGRNKEMAQKMMAFLPLKLKNKITQGDLYVYSRQPGKWNLSEGVSLYLHLDMEALGALGVYMEMKQKFISMKFSLDDEASADLLKSHLGELDKRLLDKGYRFSGSVGSLKKDKPDFVKDFMRKGEKQQKVSRYSFDMRI